MKTLFYFLMIVFAAQLAEAQLRVSADKTYFEDETGTPVLLIGTSSWDLFGRVTYTDAKMFIDSMASLGVNFVNARFMSPNQSQGPQNIYGVYPWQGSQTFASPINEPYWAHVDSIMDYLLLRHIYVWAFVNYLGHSDDEGTRVQTANSSPDVMKAWGSWVAQRYGGYTNLLWAIGGDCDPTPWQAKLDSMVSGIRAYSSNRLIANRDDDPTGDKHWVGTSYDNWRDFNYAYDQADIYGSYHWAQYCRSRVPAMVSLWAEGAYENEAPRGYTTTALNLREDMWHWMTWNPCGYIFGNCPVWNFGQFSGFTACNGIDWKTQLNSPGHLALKSMAKLLRNRHWWVMKPDTSNVVLTAGYGGGGDPDYGTAGYCSDSSSIIVYLGNARPATVTCARLKGDSTRAYWYNPEDGSTTYIGMETRGSHTYTPPAVDRVLVLDAKVMNFPAPGADTTVPPPPSPPEPLAPVNGATGVATNAILTWNASTGAESYHLQVSTDAEFATTVVDNSNITTTSSSLSGLTGSTPYYWHVRATNRGGASGYSMVWNFTTVAPPPSPLPPVLSAPGNGSAGVATNTTLRWNVSAGAESYHVQVSADTTFITTVADRNVLETDSLALNGLALNTTCSWRVSATNTGGTSSYSTVWIFTTVAPPPPPLPPVLSTPVNGSGDVALDTVLRWNALTGAVSYRVQVSADTIFRTLVADRSGIESDSLALNGLALSTTYSWRVNATNSGGTSAYSTVWDFTTTAPPPSPLPPVLVSPNQGATGVVTNPTLIWNASTGATSYHVQVSTDSAFAVTFLDQSIATALLPISGLATHTQYFWRVSASGAGGSSAYCPAWSFTSVAIPAGLVAAYAFDETTGTTVADASGHGITGNVAGATWTSQGKYGNALSFNGSSGYVDLGNPAALQITGSMTWSAWVKAAANPGDDGQIIAKSDDRAGWQLKSSPDTGPHKFGAAVSASVGSTTQRYSNTVRLLNTWYHIAGVYNAAARTLDVYVNGVLDNGVLSGTVPSSQYNANLSVNIGRRSGGYYFNGVIDEVRIYSRALAQAEIQTDMNTRLGVPPLPPSPPVLATPVNGALGIVTNPDLTWNASTGATSYRVQVSTESGFVTTVVDQSNIPTATYAVSRLESNKQYYWRVCASNTVGTSAFASPWNFTTVAPPSAPVLSTPANGSDGVATNPTLTWNASAGAASYHVQVSTDSAFGSPIVDQSNITPTSYVLTTLSMNTKYYWHVSASNNGGTSGYGASWSFTTVAPPPPPSAPALAMPVNGSTGVATDTTLTWNASAGATSYRVQVAMDTTFARTVADQSSIAATLYALRGLTLCTAYYWRVNAAGTGGTSSFSSIWHFTTVEPPPPPQPPVLTTPVNGSTGVAADTTLGWKASAAATSYRLQVATDTTFGRTVVDQSNIGATLYALRGLALRTIYYWRVSATGPGGTSEYSTTWHFMTVEPPPPPASPLLGMPVNGSTGVATDTTLTWNASTGATSYRVQVSIDTTFQGTVVDQSNVEGTLYALRGLTLNTTYSWRVSATNSGGTSAYSMVWVFTTVVPPPVPLPPVLVSPAQGTTGIPTNPTLMWDASPGATSYRVQVSTDSTFGTTALDQGNIATTTYAVSSLIPNTVYSWHVSATGAGGTGDYSATWRFTTTGVPPGLVAAYGFGEGTGTSAVDASGHGLTGTISGATWTTQGRFGGALSFNGTNSYVDLGNPALLQMTGSMTLSAWVKAVANPSGDGLIIAKSNSTSGWQLKTRVASGSHSFAASVSADSKSRAQRYGTTVRSLNTWYHVAGVYNSVARTLDVYVNGVLNNGTLSGTVPAVQYNQALNVNIGRQSGGAYFNGVIDEVRIYNRALTQAEIQSDMNSPLGPPPPPLAPLLSSPSNGSTGVAVAPTLTWTASAGAASYRVQMSVDTLFGSKVVDQGNLTTTSFAVSTLSPHTVYYWHVSAMSSGGMGAYSSTWSFTTGAVQTGLVAAYAFDEGSGTTVADISGHSLSGTVSGATWTTQGRYGNALSFNGSSSYVDLGNPALLKITGSMTWSAWVKASANPADDGQIIAKSDNGSGWQLKTSPDTGPHTFGIAVSANSRSYVARYSATTRVLNTWYFVTGVYNATSRSLDVYVNGVLDNGVLMGTVPALQYDPSVNVNIGRRSGGYSFNGIIDEVRLYNRALTPSEIQSDMITPLGSSTRPVRPASGGITQDSLLMTSWSNVTGNGIPGEYSLEQNYPNPFNPSTTIRFAIPHSAMTSVVVCDILGREIVVLESEQLVPGYYSIRWDGTSNSGRVVASGIYFVRMRALADNGESFSALRKVLLMK